MPSCNDNLYDNLIRENLFTAAPFIDLDRMRAACRTRFGRNTFRNNTTRVGYSKNEALR
jgi:hypothetical protein